MEDIMTILDIIRAWKDEEYRLSLSAEQRALLPEHPAGLIELTDLELGAVAGGMPPATAETHCGCQYDTLNYPC
jgi:mersacidin/lichenicidin family type 2 lantibiotic